MNDDVLTPVLLSKGRLQRRMVKQKCKRRALLSARRILLDTTYINLPCTSSNILNSSVDDSLQSFNIYPQSHEDSHELDTDINEYKDLNELNADLIECDDSDESDTDQDEFDYLNELNAEPYESDDLNELNTYEYVCENPTDCFNFTTCFTETNTYLHGVTDIKKYEYCKNLLLLLRDAKI